MNDATLFPGGLGEPVRPPPAPGGAPRVVGPVRTDAMLLACDLDTLLAPDHPARLVWAFVKEQDLSAFYDRIKSREGHAGRPPIDPAILLALWLYATIKAVGSARAIAEFSETDLAYRWICGGVSPGYHTLADFRSERGEEFDLLLSQSVAALIEGGHVTLERVAQDGVRVSAEAGTSSFRRQESLQECLKQAQAQVARLRKELEEDPAAATRRQAAARERAAREREERVRRALEQQKALAEIKKKNQGAEGEKSARASTTDPDARVMKMANHGFEPAYNGQFATDTGSQIIVGADVTNAGTDLHELGPMCDQLERRYGRRPSEVLVDRGYVSHEGFEEVGGKGTEIYAPVPVRRADPKDRHAPHEGDGAAVARWRRRMGTKEAEEIYAQRAATAECVNALARNRGLRRVFVRGTEKVRATFLLFALAHNMMRAVSLRRVAAATI